MNLRGVVWAISPSMARGAMRGLCAVAALSCKSGDPVAVAQATVEPAASASAGAVSRAACVAGKTGRIAFLLKQQTAFRYLHADVPFFQKTVEGAGLKVIFQSAENDPGTQVGQAENVITRSVDAIVIQPVDFNV